jgi:hypothetical protein
MHLGNKGKSPVVTDIVATVDHIVGDVVVDFPKVTQQNDIVTTVDWIAG